jgi:4-aminobutyrate aminotransferase-like enzyme
VAPLPDLYRGSIVGTAPDAAKQYAQSVRGIVERLRAAARASPFLSESARVAGQMDLPAEYVQRVYQMVRAEGGVHRR